MDRIGWMKIGRFLRTLCFWASLIIIPLGMSFFFPIFSPFSVIKVAWLQILGSLMLILSILLLRPWQGSFSLQVSTNYLRLIAPVWIFFFSWSLLSIFSIDLARSWFGSYERHFGLTVYFWLSVWFSIAVFRLGQKSADWQKMILFVAAIFTAVGGIIGVYAFLQFCGIDFAIWQEPQLLSRSIGTLGQPNFLGSFMLLTLPFSVYLLATLNSFRWRFLVAILMAYQAAGLIVSGSRAAWLASVIVVAISVIYFSWRRFGKKSIIIASVVMVGMIGLIYAVMPSRINAAFDMDGGSLALRRLFYRSAIDVFAERPLWGTGLENGGEALVQHYQPEWGVFMLIDGYTDKVHNSLADIIIQTGFIGFIFYVLLYLFFAWQCFLLFKHPEKRSFALAAAAALLAYSISLLFGLSDIAGVFYFWMIAGAVTAGNLEHNGKNFMIGGIFKKSLIFLGVPLIIIFSVTQIYYSLSNLQSDYYYLQIQRLLPQKEYFSVALIYSYLEKASLNPASREHYRRAVASSLLSVYENADDLSSKQALREVLSRIDSQLSPEGYENQLAHARLSCFLGQDKADIFDSSIVASPRRPLGYRERGLCQALSDNHQEAIADYDEALSLLPSFDDHRLNDDHRDYLFFYAYRLELEKARLYLTIGDDSLALVSFRRAYSYFPDDVKLLGEAAKLYEKMGDSDSAETMLRHAFERQRLSYEWPLALAGLAQRRGDKGVAMDYARQASALSPFQSLTLPTN